MRFPRPEHEDLLWLARCFADHVARGDWDEALHAARLAKDVSEGHFVLAERDDGGCRVVTRDARLCEPPSCRVRKSAASTPSTSASGKTPSQWTPGTTSAGVTRIPKRPSGSARRSGPRTTGVTRTSGSFAGCAWDAQSAVPSSMCWTSPSSWRGAALVAAALG